MVKESYKKVEEGFKLLKDKNEKGLDLIYEVMARPMFFVAKNIVKDDSIAEDIIQDAFIKIVENTDNYKIKDNGYSYVLKIVRNLSLNYINSYSYKNLESYNEIEEFMSSFNNEDDKDKLAVKEIFECLESNEDKKILYLQYFLDFNVREIAKEINKSKSYVAKREKEIERYLKEKLN